MARQSNSNMAPKAEDTKGAKAASPSADPTRVNLEQKLHSLSTANLIECTRRVSELRIYLEQPVDKRFAGTQDLKVAVGGGSVAPEKKIVGGIGTAGYPMAAQSESNTTLKTEEWKEEKAASPSAAPSRVTLEQELRSLSTADLIEFADRFLQRRGSNRREDLTPASEWRQWTAGVDGLDGAERRSKRDAGGGGIAGAYDAVFSLVREYARMKIDGMGEGRVIKTKDESTTQEKKTCDQCENLETYTMTEYLKFLMKKERAKDKKTGVWFLCVCQRVARSDGPLEKKTCDRNSSTVEKAVK